MREIMFRAWDKFEKEWIGDPIIDGKNGKMMGFSLLDGSFQRHFSDDEVALVQYTGLKDKNGIEIYEGDILTDHGDEGPLYMEYSNKHAGFVFVDKFDPYGTTLYTTIQISYEGFEVIGNIYENPELLEKEQSK